MLWPETNKRAVFELEPVSLGLFHGNLQPLTALQTFDPLVVQLRSCISQHGRDTTMPSWHWPTSTSTWRNCVAISYILYRFLAISDPPFPSKKNKDQFCVGRSLRSINLSALFNYSQLVCSAGRSSIEKRSLKTRSS